MNVNEGQAGPGGGSRAWRGGVIRRAEVRNAALFTGQGALGAFAGSLSLGVLLPALIVRFGGSDLLIGVLNTLASAVGIPGMLLGAHVGVRVRRRVTAALLWNLASWCAFAPPVLILLTGGASMPLGLFAAAVGAGVVAGGLCGSVGSVVQVDLFSRVTTPERRGRITGIAGLFSGAAGLGGGVCLSFLLGRHGFPDNYAYAGALGLVLSGFGCLFYLGLRELPGTRPRPGAAPLRLRESLRVIQGDGRFRRVLLATALKFAFNAVTIFLVPTALRRHGLGDAFVGHYAVLSCAVSLGMGPVQGWSADRLGIGWTACAGGIVAAAGMLIFPHAGSETALLAASGLVLIGGSAIATVFYLAPMQFSPPEHRASYIASRYLVESLSGLVCTPLAGWAITAFDPRWAFTGGGMAAVASGLLLALATQRRPSPAKPA